MNTRVCFVLILTLALLTGAALWATLTQAAPGAVPLAQGGAPTAVSYQGEVRVNDDPYTGDGYFKFAVVNAAGDATYWSNDGSSTGGGEPTAAVQLAVSEGLFGVLLGDTTLGGMTQALTADVFSQPDRYLRVWFSTSVSGPFDQLTPDTRIAAVPYALQAQEAADADTVDGLHASQLETHYQNVVVVAKSGGDYTGVQAAIDSISDAAADNAYLVWVAPGAYSETVTMKPYVHLQGAGQEATVITSTVSGSAWPLDQATLILASNTSLRDLTVSNGGMGQNGVALLVTEGTTHTLVADVTAQALGSSTYNRAIFLYGSGTGVTLQQVTALAKNGNLNHGLDNYFGAMAVLRGGSFTARGGITRAIGINNVGSAALLDAADITVLAENSVWNNGMSNYNGAVAVLRGGFFTGRGGVDAYGIASDLNGARLDAEGVTVLAEDGSSSNHGLVNDRSAVTTLRGGSFTARGGAETYGIAIHDIGTTLEAESVTVLAESGGDSNQGLINDGGAVATLRGGSFTARGGTNAYGIYSSDSGTTLEAESVTALAENGSDANYGLLNHSGAAATLRGGAFTGRGGADAHGIQHSEGTLEAESVTALGENGSSSNCGLYNLSGTARADSSQFTGINSGLHLESGTVYLGVSQLDGDAINVSGTLICFQVYDSDYVAYTCP
jgi:hypothetical protein